MGFLARLFGIEKPRSLSPQPTASRAYDRSKPTKIVGPSGAVYRPRSDGTYRTDSGDTLNAAVLLLLLQGQMQEGYQVTHDSHGDGHSGHQHDHDHAHSGGWDHSHDGHGHSHHHSSDFGSHHDSGSSFSHDSSSSVSSDMGSSSVDSGSSFSDSGGGFSDGGGSSSF